MPTVESTTVARQGAVLVKWGFEKYRSAFRRVTRTSQRHFEAADWPGVQRDMLERLNLYPVVVEQLVEALGPVLGGVGRDEALWTAMKGEFSALMARRADLELGETFFNSVTRKFFTAVGVDAEREYVHLEAEPEGPAGLSQVRTYPGSLVAAPGA